MAGRYRLEEVIGRGGMGTVWRAIDQQHNTVVALKRAHSGAVVDEGDPATPSGAADQPEQTALRRLRREARIAAGLSHPHVVGVFDVVPDDWQWWLVMEHVPARSLAEVIEKQGTLEPREAARLGAQLADALAAVHAKGVQHRDVKPGNVLVATGGDAKLADFGISHMVRGEETATSTGLIPGTPGYLAPEVADGRDPGPASDVFSLGATLFAAVEGTTPVGQTSPPMAAVRRAATGQLLSPRQAGPLAPVLEAMLRVHPADRPDAACAARLLGDVAAGRVPSIPAGRRRVRRGLVAAGLTISGVLLSTAGLLIFRPDTPAPALAATVGDPRTANPCALVDTGPLGQFSDESHVDGGYGGFDRCDVVLSEGAQDMVDIQVKFAAPDRARELARRRAQLESTGQLGSTAQLRVDRPLPPDAKHCERAVLLPDGNVVQVITKPVDDDVPPVLGGRAAPMCRITDVATDTVVAVVGRGGEIPRRGPFEPGSLGTRHACALLDDPALRAAVPGLRATDATPGFGDWSCTWSSASAAADVKVVLNRDYEPLSGDAPATEYEIDGRTARFEADDYSANGCTVRVDNGQYSDATGDRPYEQLVVDVQNKEGRTLNCEPAARALAGAATARLR